MNHAVGQVLGKSFIHSWVDYLIVGAAWSIVVTGILLVRPTLLTTVSPEALAALILVVNSAHFAASTVRLYSDPQNFTKFPFLTMLLPIVTVAVLAIFIWSPV